MLKRFVEEIGVYIIFGVGFYVDVIYFLEIRVMLVEQFIDVFMNEIFYGVDGISIKCGIIGEIGCFWFLIESERKVFQVIVYVQVQFGCFVIIYFGWSFRVLFQII